MFPKPICKTANLGLSLNVWCPFHWVLHCPHKMTWRMCFCPLNSTCHLCFTPVIKRYFHFGVTLARYFLLGWSLINILLLGSIYQPQWRQLMPEHHVWLFTPPFSPVYLHSMNYNFNTSLLILLVLHLFQEHHLNSSIYIRTLRQYLF